MTSTDLVTIIGNLSLSLYPAQRLITAGAYLLGVLFVLKAITKFKKATARASHEKMITPMMYLFMGAVLLYLPSAMRVMAATTFGSGNILTYAQLAPTNIYSSMGLLIRTAGVLWFVRGCVLIAHASEPGAKDGPKGLVFIFAGILSMNFDNTVSIINSMMSYMVQATLSLKASQGF